MTAATPVPKVAVIVGPVGGLTPTYVRLANQAARVATDAGAEVVKVYSPNATWPAVKAATDGASIVVYLGHGNGFPSRYRDQLFPPSQNGFGLNPVAGADDRAHQYFGEASVEDLHLAPNAVVVLSHLCYASGNTEPGLPQGTRDQAIQRVDNYAAGFLRAGARAVVAEGHLGPAYYVRSLLTSGLSIEKIWERSPSAHGNAFSVASSRSAGFTQRLDPDRPGGGFYRSLVSAGLDAPAVRAGAAGRADAAVSGPPDEPSLAGLDLAFGTPALRSLPIVGTTSTFTLPLPKADVAKLPKGVMVGVRWDPILLDPPPAPAPSDPEAASPDPSPQASEAPAVSASAQPATPEASPTARPDASPEPVASPARARRAADPTARETPGPSAAPDARKSPNPSASAGANEAARSSAAPDASTAPDPSAAPAADAEVAMPEPDGDAEATDPPEIDLVVPEEQGAVVTPAKAKYTSKGLRLTVEYPAAPGLYRLVTTLHASSGVAFDAATQALLAPVLVRIGGPVGVAYGVTPNLSVQAGAEADLPVRVMNSGLERWDQEVVPPRGVPRGRGRSARSAARGAGEPRRDLGVGERHSRSIAGREPDPGGGGETRRRGDRPAPAHGAG